MDTWSQHNYKIYSALRERDLRGFRVRGLPARSSRTPQYVDTYIHWYAVWGPARSSRTPPASSSTASTDDLSIAAFARTYSHPPPSSVSICTFVLVKHGIGGYIRVVCVCVYVHTHTHKHTHAHTQEREKRRLDSWKNQPNQPANTAPAAALFVLLH